MVLVVHVTLQPDAVVDYQDDSVAVIRHDARTLPLDDGSVDLIVTSPPYFALRSYRDGCESCDGTGNTSVGSQARSADKRLSDAAVSPQGMHVKRGDHDNPDSAASKRSATGKRPDNDGNCPECSGTGSGHFDGQIGSEDTPDLFLDALDEWPEESPGDWQNGPDPTDPDGPKRDNPHERI